MLCERCGQREATIFSYMDVQGKKSQSHLCEACYNEVHGGGSFTNPMGSTLQLFRTRGGRCPHCGLSYQAFLNRGLLGCPYCYEAFRGALDREVLPRMQRGIRYRGRAYGQGKAGSRVKSNMPDSGEGLSQELMAETTTSPQQRMLEIEAALQEAVKREDYEAAARLRDERDRLQKEVET